MVRQRSRVSPLLDSNRRWLFLVVTALMVVTLALVACTSEEDETVQEGQSDYITADTNTVTDVVYPPYVTRGIRDAYAFAVEHPEVLRYMPCYCGCGLTVDHTSNLDCFIDGVTNDGRIVFSKHARYCEICLEIARDAESLLGQGISLTEIRSYVDSKHGQKGPGTDTPRPPVKIVE